MSILEGGTTMQRATKVLSVAGPLLAVLLSCGVQQLRAQSPVWTQIPLPNATSCYTPQESPSSAAPSHCDWGNSPESIGAGYSAILNNPGVGNTAGGVYISGCTYLNGTPDYFGSPYNIWQVDPANNVFPGQACATGPLFSLQSNYIYWWQAGYGLEFNGHFSGWTNDGSAGIFYTDSQFTQGGREYGIAYVFQSNTLSLYWSYNTNCVANCYTGYDSGNRVGTGTPISASYDQCIINTGQAMGPRLTPSNDYIYDIYFTSSGSNTYVNCIIKDASSWTALTTNYFLPKAGFTFDYNTGIFRGMVDSSYPAFPTMDNQPDGAGWYTASILPTTHASPSGNAAIQMNWIKVAK
jgi:hypothetical protein